MSNDQPNPLDGMTFPDITAALGEIDADLAGAQTELRARTRVFEQSVAPIRAKIRDLNQQRARLRAALKPKAVANTRPLQLGPTSPPQRRGQTFGGVQIAIVQKLLILDEGAAATYLAEAQLDLPVTFVTAEVVYTFNKNAIRAWLLEDENRQRPGVLVLTNRDDEASQQLRVLK